MDATERQDLSVFWCTQCNKPFQKANTPRAKVPGQETHAAGSKTATSPIEEATPSSRELSDQDAAGDTVVPSALALPDHESPALWNSLDWDVGGINLADTLNTESFSFAHSPDPSVQNPHAAFSTGQTNQMQDDLSWLSPSIPKTPTMAVRSLVHRPTAHSGTQRIINLMLNNLKSFPLMIQRHNGLPPFIHKSVMSPDIAEGADMESLTNCLSLVQMTNSDFKISRSLFWKNVRMECERLSAEHLNLSRWELLAAIQALTIYVLVRLGEGETEGNNIDLVLVKAVSLIIQQLNRADVTCQTQCMSCNNGLETNWKEWIFRESRRRLGVIYRVVNMVFYFDPAAMCSLPGDLVMAPLPARRQLWEAGDESAWRVESHRGPPGTGDSFGLAVDGELVRLDEGGLSCNDAWVPRSRASDDGTALPRCAASWEEWCSGADGFGGLVMLAASFFG